MLGRDSKGRAVWLPAGYWWELKLRGPEGVSPEFHCPVHIFILDFLPPQL